jgi:hypothetical protein
VPFATQKSLAYLGFWVPVFNIYVITIYFSIAEIKYPQVFSYNRDDKNWNPETQVCQAFLCGKGHNTDRCTWMVGSEDKFNINPDVI